MALISQRSSLPVAKVHMQSCAHRSGVLVALAPAPCHMLGAQGLRRQQRPVATQAASGSKSSLTLESRNRVLPLISELCEQNAVVQRFETFAGRGAMIGFLVAISFELVVPQQKGILGAWDGSASCLAWLGAALICLSATLAVASLRRWRSQSKLLEPVMTSLTSKERSAGSLSKRNVDKAVDFILDTVFTKTMLEEYFPLDDLLVDDFPRDD